MARKRVLTPSKRLDLLREGPLALAAAALLVCASAAAQGPAQLTGADRAEIQALTAEYLRTLFSCSAEEYANLFAPVRGYFASSFRGQMTGREQLVALVESEPHCTAPAGSSAGGRAGGTNVPTVEIEVTDEGVFGVADLGIAQYQDEYVKTGEGWRFASRWVVNRAEVEAGLSAREEQAIVALSGGNLGENWVADAGGVERLLNAGVTLGLDDDGSVTGRVYLGDGSRYDDVYEQLGPGEWRIASRTHVPEEN